MVLKELEIQGFKSFPDRTKVQIGQGITAVVGPNGSGKSNISDAIRWVLGETSSKQLRGAGKMEDVIFGGTQSRSAMGYAAVKLVVDNSDRRIEVDSDEVTIGRKLYRSGESEYSINGQNVRLKDIYELFLDTGLGRDGYSIISQGRIAEIVGAKSNERREIFEEASGIARYRYRKNDAERRLAAAEDNLSRLRDILDELEARVVPLEKESQKAQQFLEWSQRRKELEVTLWVDDVRRAKDTVREQQRRYEAAQAQHDDCTRQIEQIDADTEDIRMELQALTLQIERCNSDIRSITEEISGSDSRIAVLQNDIGHNLASIRDLKAELEQSAQGSQSIQSEIAQHGQAVEQIQTQAQALARRIEELEGTLERIQAQNLASGERRGQVAGELARLTQRQTAARVESARAESAADTARQRLEQVRQEHGKNGEALARLEQDSADNMAYLRQIQETMTRLDNIKNGLSMKLEGRRKQLDQADAAEQQIQRGLEAAQQRLSVLKDLERNLDGYQQSVKAVMRAAQNRRLQGIIGPVSSILTVRPGYETAIETALGFAMQNLVVQNEAAAKAGIAFLRSERAGRATFLPLDTMQGSRMDTGRLSGNAQVASTLVEYDPRYENVVQNLLGRIVVVDEINEASRVARSLSYRNRVVTCDGQVINAGGSFTGGSTSRSAGFFSRRQEIEELKKKIVTLSAQQEQAQKDTDRWREEVDALSAELTAAESEAITAGGDRIRAEMEEKRLETALSQTRAAAELMDGQLRQLEQQIAGEEASHRAAEEETRHLTGEITAMEEELARISGDDDSFLETRSRLSDELGQARMQRLSAEKDVQLHQAAIESLKARTGEQSQRAQDIRRSVASLEALNLENRQKIEDIRAAKEECSRRIAKKEEEIRTAGEERLQKEGGIARQSQKVRSLTDQREQMGQEMARLAERRAAAETEYDQIVAKLWEEYQLTMSAAQELCVPFENAAELRRQVQEVRGRIRGLGNVNVGAIEEYQEVRQRYDFLKAQVEDVEKSKAELGRMISELSAEMRRIFTQSFHEIDRNFGRIFQELFGGGSASLTLEDEENVLESGIDIHVAPPGKVIKNLTALSGGEQSLVAISIYFAILAVNPAPFCILDEIEAALDDVNVVRYAQYLRRITEATQFIVITHRRGTMEAADVLYGVTMQEDGVSKLLRLDLEHVDASLIS